MKTFLQIIKIISGLSLMFLSICLIGVGSSLIPDLIKLPPLDTDSRLAWTLQTRHKIIGLTSDQIGNVYLQTAGMVYKINPANGEIVWSFHIKGYPMNHPLIAENDLVVLADNNSYVYTFSTENGKQLWKSQNQLLHFATDYINTTQGVYIAGFNNGLISYNDYGEIVWKQGLPGRSRIFLSQTEKNIIAAGNDMILFLEPDTGIIQNEISVNGSILSQIYANDDNLFIGISFNSMIVSFNKNTTKEIWHKNLSYKEVNCVTGNNLFIYSSGGGITKLDKDTGDIQWSNDKISDLTCPIITVDRIYVRKRDRSLYIYDTETGELLSYIKIKPEVFIRTTWVVDPVLVDNILITQIDNKHLAGYEIPQK